MTNRVITDEMLIELAQDIEADGYSHICHVFNQWRSRNKLRVNIAEVYPLIKEQIERN